LATIQGATRFPPIELKLLKLCRLPPGKFLFVSRSSLFQEPIDLGLRDAEVT
jgi:hypothetical protein